MILFAIVCIGLATASVPKTTFLVPPILPQDWVEEVGLVEPSTQLKLVITIKTNSENLQAAAQSVSNPSSPQYGKYLTTSQIGNLVLPVSGSFDVVQKWLSDEEISFKIGATGDMFHVTSTVEKVERTLSTSIRNVRNHVTGQTAIRASSLFLPAHVHPHIRAIFGLHGLPLPPKSNLHSKATFPVTPTVIETRYSVSGVTPSGSDANHQAVAEFQSQFMNQKDLTQFFQQYVPKAKAGDEKVSKYVGPNADQQGYGIEALLDIEYIMGVNPGLKTEFWIWPAYQFCLDLVNWTQYLLAEPHPPLVHSVSYGWQGNLSQVGCTDSEVDIIDTEFQKLAAKGLTIIFASGDSGSGYSTVNGKPLLWPCWPASSPWVTAVGSTRFINQTIGDEQATDSFGSGGGFSFQFPQASWQKTAIASFFKAHDPSRLPPASSYNAIGRATPDVSALGDGFQVIVNGRVESVGGTSASAPTFAGLISLINEKRLAAGKKPLGFLNPWLYANPTAFTDVTVGDDRWGRGPFRVPLGFDTTKGWDPVTGLGTPKFQELLKAGLNLP